MRIAVCDDDYFITEQVEEALKKIEQEDELELATDTFSDGMKLCEAIQAGEHYDIIYLDIEMKEMNGIAAARKIREEDPYVVLIFISAYDSYCRQLFDVEPLRFLDKPINWTVFREYFSLAYQKVQDINQRFVFHANKRVYQIPHKEIMYLESKRRVIHIHCREKEYSYYGKMDQAWEQLKDVGKYYIRVQKSYIVNYTYITSMSMREVQLQNGVNLSLSGAVCRDDAGVKWNCMELHAVDMIKLRCRKGGVG